jgi:septal ring factor EnvC (AmiA/AmiB activator)
VFRIREPSLPTTRSSLTPGQRKIQKLEEKVRRLESKLRRAERQDAVNAERLMEIASENQRIRHELQDALEEKEGANERAQKLQKERDQFYAWWINELNLSQSFWDNPAMGYQSFPQAPTFCIGDSEIGNFAQSYPETNLV